MAPTAGTGAGGVARGGRSRQGYWAERLGSIRTRPHITGSLAFHTACGKDLKLSERTNGEGQPICQTPVISGETSFAFG
jgi:hypothetical protein